MADLRIQVEDVEAVHDRATTAGSIMGVVAIIFLVGQQLSILFGLLSYMSVLVDHSPAELWVCTSNTENVNSGGTLPMRYVDRISGMEGVEWVEPIIRTGGLYTLSDGGFTGLQGNRRVRKRYQCPRVLRVALREPQHRL